MPLGSGQYHAELFDRGGMRRVGPLDKLSSITWNRIRDDISEAKVVLSTPSKECVEQSLSVLEPNRSELVIYRDGMRVWEGPVTLVGWYSDRVEISARDIMHYTYRTIMRSAYDNSYPNSTTVLNRVMNILNGEMARKEALSPPVNVLPYVHTITTPDDARTSRVTKPWESTVFEHVDNLAWRAGIDYTVAGRSLYLFDTNTNIGETIVASAEDFIGFPVVTSYGMEGATFAAVTDGQGTVGYTGGVDPYYGLIEILDDAYDEESDEGPAPSQAELLSQAKRNISGRNPTPVVVRLPNNTQINPASTVFEMENLIPGVRVPLRANLPGKVLSQMQKIDEVSFDYDPKAGETVKVVLSAAPDSSAVGDLQ